MKKIIDNQTIGNKYDKDCELECLICGENANLCLVAHRSTGKKITGFVCFCQTCFAKTKAGFGLKLIELK